MFGPPMFNDIFHVKNYSYWNVNNAADGSHNYLIQEGRKRKENRLEVLLRFDKSWFIFPFFVNLN